MHRICVTFKYSWQGKKSDACFVFFSVRLFRVKMEKQLTYMEIGGHWKLSSSDAIWFYYDQEEMGQVYWVFPKKWQW